MIADLFVAWFGTNPIVHGLVGGLVIAGMNLLGASLIFVWRDPSERALDGALGFAAGVMLAAAFTSLIIPGIETYSGGNPLPVLVGVLLGAAVLDRSDGLVPHAHYLLTGTRRADAADPDADLSVTDERLTPVILFILAITLHNVPEGLAVSIPLKTMGVSRWRMVGAAVFSSLPQPIGAVIAFAFVRWARAFLPFGFGLAAGAMVFLVLTEFVPEALEHGQDLDRGGYPELVAGVTLGVVGMLPLLLYG